MSKDAEKAEARSRVNTEFIRMYDMLVTAHDELCALQSKYDDAVGQNPQINGVGLAIEYLLADI